MTWLSRLRLSKKLDSAQILICALFATLGLLLPAIPRITPPAVVEKAETIPGFGLVENFYTILDSIDFAIRDNLAFSGKKAPADDRLFYLAIDNESIQLNNFSENEIAASPALTLMKQSWPWPRAVYSHVLDKLFSCGAKVVVLDLLFLSPSPDDAQFKETLDRYKDRVILGFNIAKVPNLGGTNNLDMNYPTPSLIPDHKHDSRVAYVNFDTDGNGVIRNASYYRYKDDTDKEFLPSLAAAALTAAGLKESVPQNTEPHLMRFAGPAGSYPSLSIYQIFDTKHWDKNLKSGAIFKDKIVFIGPKGNWSQDKHGTSQGIMPGPEVHLNAMGAALNHAFIRFYWMVWLTVPLTVLTAFALNVLIRHPFVRLLAILGTGVFVYTILLQEILFNQLSIYIHSATPFAVFWLSSLSCLTYEFVRERMEKKRVRSTLERYVSKNIVSTMLDQPGNYQSILGGARKEVTVLFSDIRGFTTMTESSDSQTLVTQLNEYLTEMVECVFNQEGTLDKFIGDAVMAVWGNTVTRGPKQDAVQAILSALAMQQALEKLNLQWKAQGRPELHIGIGLNHGEVIVGNMGSPRRMEFTVIGDAVNLASRLESLTKEYHVDNLLGENIAALVRDQFILRSVALVTVKGKTKPVEIFTVLGEANTTLSSPLNELLPLYEEGIYLYRKREFLEAAELFAKCLKLMPDDFLSRLYHEESIHLAQNLPDVDWTGVVIMKQK